jgi:hypothetical protein
MKKSLVTILLTLSGVCGFSSPVQALPDMRLDEFIRHVNQGSLSSLFDTLEIVRQYENGMPEFASNVQLEDGSLIFSVYLNDQDTVVLSEEISYYPDCYGTENCSSTVQFERANHEDSQTLIETVWGQEVLEDFQSSILVAEESNAYDTRHWYEGNLFNYETLHREPGAGFANVYDFRVISKQDSLTERIDQYRYCVSNPDDLSCWY